MQGVVGQLPLPLGDALLHAGEGLGQAAQLVAALQGNRGEVVAEADASRHPRQLLHRLRQAARQQQRAEQRAEEGGQGDQQNVMVQRGEGLLGLVQGFVQQRQHLVIAGAGQVAPFAQVALVAGLQQAAAAVLFLLQDFLAQVLMHAGRQGADPAGGRATLDGHQGQLQMGQLAQLLGEVLVDVEAHHHPGDRQRRADGRGHQQVDLALHRQEEHLGALPGLLGHPPGQALGRRGADALVAADLQAAVQRQQQHGVGIDARAMVGQRRTNGVAIAAGHRVLEAEVGRQHLHRIAQLAAAQLDQLLQHPATDAEVLAQLALHRHAGGRLDREVQRAHHHRQEEDQDPGDARLKAMAELHSPPS